jgi:hypothetical protein
MSLPFQTSTVGVNGAAAATPIAVGGIRTGDKLLCVVSFDPTLAGGATAHDPNSFTVSDDAIEHATTDLSGKFVHVVYSNQA